MCEMEPLFCYEICPHVVAGATKYLLTYSFCTLCMRNKCHLTFQFVSW